MYQVSSKQREYCEDWKSIPASSSMNIDKSSLKSRKLVYYRSNNNEVWTRNHLA